MCCVPRSRQAPHFLVLRALCVLAVPLCAQSFRMPRSSSSRYRYSLGEETSAQKVADDQSWVQGRKSRWEMCRKATIGVQRCTLFGSSQYRRTCGPFKLTP